MSAEGTRTDARSNGPDSGEGHGLSSAQIDRRAELLSSDRLSVEGAAELDELTAAMGAAMNSADLRVRRLSADEDPDLLARLVATEPVHPFSGPADVADRLDEDRRCFVLEHPGLPARPFNVVWCALWNGVCGDLAQILDTGAPTGHPGSADCAVFYSIWNAEPGLVGLPGGSKLLTGSIDALRAEFPGITTFVTLSPIPGFRRWYDERRAKAPDETSSAATGDSMGEPDDERAIVGACATYLTSLRDDGRPLDPVARFHLGNGARLVAINQRADLSERGIERSYGLMANYRYEPEDRDSNRRQLADGAVAVGNAVAALLA